MADVDQLNKDVQMIKRFLDAHTDGDWRDPAKWRAGYGAGPLGSNAPTEAFRHRGDGGAGMVTDEEQTRADRIALGYDDDPNAPKAQEGPAGASDEQAGTSGGQQGENEAGAPGNSEEPPPQGQ